MNQTKTDIKNKAYEGVTVELILRIRNINTLSNHSQIKIS